MVAITAMGNQGCVRLNPKQLLAVSTMELGERLRIGTRRFHATQCIADGEFHSAVIKVTKKGGREVILEPTEVRELANAYTSKS